MKRAGQPVLFDTKVYKKSCQWQVFCMSLYIRKRPVASPVDYL